MFKELSRDDILNELAVIQNYLDKLGNTEDCNESVRELNEHKRELLETIHEMDRNG